ncbi:MAG: DUF2892 domain-containing protein [Chitinophagaceae bacterium]|nr:DUF2892 domain-containing protein [Chitinophagaceae bacterium]
MKKNLGNADRIIRLCIAGLLAVLWFQNIITGIWGIVALAVAAVFVLTSLVSWCPLYAMFGLKSTSKKPV